MSGIGRIRIYLTWRWAFCWLLPWLITFGAHMIWHAGIWEYPLFIILVMLAYWLWQLRLDWRKSYADGMMLADRTEAADIAGYESRYICLSKPRRLFRLWVIVVYDTDSIRVYQGIKLGRKRIIPEQAVRSRLARQAG